jgi:hypothetical protein
MVIFFISASGQISKNINQEYTGTYKFKDFKSCPISLIINQIFHDH